MGLFEDIRVGYGISTSQDFKGWNRLSEKLAAAVNRRNFLLRCRYKNVFPKHIINNIMCVYSLQTSDHPFYNDIGKCLYNFRRSILTLEIKIAIWNLNKLIDDIKRIKEKLKGFIVTDIFVTMIAYNERLYERNFMKIKSIQIKKLESLIANQKSQIVVNRDDWLVNLSNKVLPVEVQSCLALGPNFSIKHTNRDLPIVKLVSDIEYFINAIKVEDSNSLRLKAVNMITNFRNRFKNKKEDNIFVSIYNYTREYLRENNNIIVVRSDKGNVSVVMNKKDYLEKMNNIVTDEASYLRIGKDPTLKIQDNHNKLVKRLFGLKLIDDNTQKRLIVNNSLAPRLYGLPKIHKEDCPLRPVVSCLGCPTYGLARFVSGVLTKISPSLSFSISNSYSLVDKLKQVTLPVGYILVSLDVKSLFTSIPKELVLNSIESNWPLIEQHTGLDKNNFRSIIEFIFDNSYFCWDGKFYKQIFGTAMGNPASPILANLVMDGVLNCALSKLTFNIPFLYCYVDDILLAVPEDGVEVVLQCFNSINDSIQFTLELESEGRINYLDTTLIRSDDGRILTDWFSKNISSGRILNYHSQHNLKYKRNIILELHNRIMRLSHPMFHKKNNKILTTLLKSNGYPIGFINTVLNSNKRTHKDKQVNYYKVPYIQGLSQSLMRVLSTDTCKLVTYNTKTVNDLFTKVKDKVPSLSKSNVIYQISCNDCSGVYIGQTKQYLYRRIQNHKQDCFAHNFLKPEKTALASHHFEFQHSFDLDNVRILDMEENLQKRLFLEKIHIAGNINNINLKDDSSSSELTVYTNLII